MPNIVPINSGSDYPNASFRSQQNNDIPERPQKKKIEPVISKDQVTVQKQSAFRRAMHKFVAEDSTSIKEYLIYDVAIPTIKDTLSSIVDYILYGKSMHGRSAGMVGGTRGGNYVRYNTVSSTSSSRPAPVIRSDSNSAVGLRDRLALDSFIFKTRDKADTILDYMSTAIDDGGYVSALNLYDWCDMIAPHTYEDYIWTDLSMVSITTKRYYDEEEGRYKIGYLLNLPNPHLKGKDENERR